MFDLRGKTAIATGSSSGIEFAIVQGLLDADATVVLNGRTQRNVEVTLAKLQARYPRERVRGVAADLATAEGCRTLVDAEPSTDILVNNLGLFDPKDFFDASDDGWSRVFETSVMSVFACPALISEEWRIATGGG